MKIEKINSNKIKVVIDQTEAREWNVNSSSLSKNTPEIQELFWSAIRQAEKDVQFEVNGAKLFVESLSRGENGISLNITKVKNDTELSEAIERSARRGTVSKTEIRLKRRKSLSKPPVYIYKFRNFDDIISAAKHILNVFNGESTVYCCDNTYYLHLDPIDALDASNIESVTCEFGRRIIGGPVFLARLREHGEAIIKNNALDILLEFFA